MLLQCWIVMLLASSSGHARMPDPTGVWKGSYWTGVITPVERRPGVVAPGNWVVEAYYANEVDVPMWRGCLWWDGKVIQERSVSVLEPYRRWSATWAFEGGCLTSSNVVPAPSSFPTKLVRYGRTKR